MTIVGDWAYFQTTHKLFNRAVYYSEMCHSSSVLTWKDRFKIWRFSKQTLNQLIQLNNTIDLDFLFVLFPPLIFKCILQKELVKAIINQHPKQMQKKISKKNRRLIMDVTYHWYQPLLCSDEKRINKI